MKRTKKQKIKASKARVNSQLEYKFTKTYNLDNKIKRAVYTDNSVDLASIKKELLKSLIIYVLILILLGVIYWVQN